MSYADAFDHIPDDVVLRVSSRDMQMSDGMRCLCGWAVREALAGLTDRSADDIGLSDIPDTITAECQKQFGGHWSDWSDVYWDVGISDRLPEIETAWVNRLDKAVTRIAMCGLALLYMYDLLRKK